MDVPDCIGKLIKAMMEVDRAGASVLMDHALAEGMSPELFMSDVLDPALLAVGKSWGEQKVSLAQAFVGAKIAEDVLLRCLPKGEVPPTALRKGIVVIGNIEDDFHSLGRRMIIPFLQASNWEVHDLGNDVTAETFVDKALQVGASIVAASAMMQTTALNIRKLRDLIDGRGLARRLKLAVGGAVFNWRPELVAEVGGDGTAGNAGAVDALLSRLLFQAGEGKSP